MITSAQNPKVKLVRALMAYAKTRREEALVVLEGSRLIRDVLQQGYSAQFALHQPDFADSDLLAAFGEAEVQALDSKLFDELSDTEHSQGLLAVFPLPKLPFPPQPTLLLALDGIKDAGNVGTILRTAAAAGVDGVLALPHTVDAFNPKAVRAGMGAQFRLPFSPIGWEGLPRQFPDWHLVAADATQPHAQPYTDTLWANPTILVIGSEAHGLSPQLETLNPDFVFIPMAKGVESLNSSIAAAILLFEIRRQRLLAGL